MVVRVGAAMDADQAAGTVVFRRPSTQVEARRSDRARNDADPGLITEERAVLADEDGV